MHVVLLNSYNKNYQRLPQYKKVFRTRDLIKLIRGLWKIKQNINPVHYRLFKMVL